MYTLVIGVGPRPDLPRLSDKSWSYQKPTDSSFFEYTAMTRVVFFASVAIRWLTAANCKTGLRSNGSSRNRLVIAAAPNSSARTSRPMTAAGSRPTGVKTLYRPPTSSGMVRMSSSRMPSALARSRSLPFGPVIGTINCLSQSDLRP